MNKRQYQLAFMLSSLPHYPVALGVQVTIRGLFAMEGESPAKFGVRFWPQVTFSNKERKDMIKALNYLKDFVHYGLSYKGIIFESECVKYWQENFNHYMDDWYAVHQEELDEWNSRPENVFRNGIREFCAALTKPKVKRSYEDLG